MTDFSFDKIRCGDVVLNVATIGTPSNPPLIGLHGFPEFWIAWREVARELADDFFVVLPDQRGFNLSDKPEGEEAYRANRMVADLAALADQVSPGRPSILAGHDWGASIAYAYAFAYPQRLSHLVIANGVHPICFQRAILEDEEQRRASQYFLKLRAPDAAIRMAENDFARTMNMIAGFSKLDWMTPDIAAEYRAAWAQPGAMQAMLHWYNSSPVLVPATGEPAPPSPLLDLPVEKTLVRMPHLLVWGEADEALRPSCLRDLPRHAPDLSITNVPGAGHWILHEKPKGVAAAIRAFIG